MEYVFWFAGYLVVGFILISLSERIYKTKQNDFGEAVWMWPIFILMVLIDVTRILEWFSPKEWLHFIRKKIRGF